MPNAITRILRYLQYVETPIYALHPQISAFLVCAALVYTLAHLLEI